MREVVCNAMDVHGKVFTMRIPFVCEVRRLLLSVAMLEYKGFHLTVNDDCRKLRVKRSICEDKENPFLWMWSSRADCKNVGNLC